MDDIRPTSPEMDKADARDGQDIDRLIEDEKPAKPMTRDDFPVLSNIDFDQPYFRSARDIIETARALGITWTMSPREAKASTGHGKDQITTTTRWISLSVNFPGGGMTASGHKSYQEAFEGLARWIAEKIYPRYGSIAHRAGQLAENPSLYGLSELMSLFHRGAPAERTPLAVAMSGSLLTEAVRYLRDFEFKGNPAPNEYEGICPECKGYAGMVLPGDPAPRPGHNRGCKVALFLNKFEGIVSDGIGRPRG